LAATYRELNRAVEALPLDQKALELISRVRGEKDSFTLISLSNLAEDYRSLGRHSDSLRLEKKVLSLFTEAGKYLKNKLKLNNETPLLIL
jgi:hypothetical protein